LSVPPEDRAAIEELISLHGHLFDEGELDRLDELFTTDVVYDASAFGGARLIGIDAIRQAALELGERNPVAHHVTNVVIAVTGGGEVRVRSKGLAVMADGTSGSVSYEDTVVRGPSGWRIKQRQVHARRTPLGRG
jgi:hypothetical protein